MAPSAQNNKQVASDSEVDVEKGRSSQLLTPYPDYQATYRIETLAAAGSQRRRKARFLHAFGFSVFLVLFLHFTAKDISRFVRTFGSRGRDIATMPWTDDPDACVRTADWIFDVDTTAFPHHFHHAAEAAFHLPVSSDLLYLVSRGTASLAHGSVEIIDSGEPTSDVVEVDVKAFYNDIHDLQQLVKVCLLQPEEGNNGVGIFAPMHLDYPQHHQIQFQLTVRLPRPSDHSLLSIKKFETYLPFFRHQVGDLKDSVLFDSISLKSSNMPMSVDSLAAHRGELYTSNAPIEGSFNSSTMLDLRTSNSPIKAGIGLLNGDDGSFTRVNMKTSNGPIATNISLYSTSEAATGGAFGVDIATSNSPLYIGYLEAPLDHILQMTARTSNSPVRTTLHNTYEGSFQLVSSPFFRPTVHSNPGTEDPAHHGRHRSVETNSIGKAEVRGVTRWVPSERQKELGWVNISTSNLGVDLIL
ncbi:hypothetical protein AcV7_001984 [Taiwanofungus camphoratus]|nr:hypothetical protein AcV7_001984 [Antrodia cinnamomea]